MSRIRTTEAICLRTQDWHESSTLVTLFTFEYGKITGIAKGARRPKSRFGAALNLFARSQVIYYYHPQRTVFTISDAELVWSPSAIALLTDRFLAAGVMAEFLLKAVPLADPNQNLYRLLATNLEVLAQATTGFILLTHSFLLKAASFLGFRPELHNCLVCRQPVTARPAPWIVFDPRRGGTVCLRCSEAVPADNRLSWEELEVLDKLLYTPSAQVPALELKMAGQAAPGQLPGHLQSLITDFLSYHFVPMALNLRRWSLPEPAK